MTTASKLARVYRIEISFANSTRYPAIIGIVIGSLIALSVILCLVRCLCCGLECCCGIFACCNACCPSPRRRDRTQYRDPPPPQFHPSPYQGYQQNPPPLYNHQPQFAQFDVGKKSHANEDALPAMPSWENAGSRRIADDTHHEEMELGTIGHGDESKAPMLANQAPTPYTSHQESHAPYSDTLPPYQGQQGYRGQTPTGAASFGRSTPQGYTNTAQRPGVESHSSYGSSIPPPQPSYAGHQYQGSSNSMPTALAPGQSQQQTGYQAYQTSHQQAGAPWRDV